MFTGYSDKVGDFFWELRFNNSREWFNPRKAEFDQLVMQPTKALANELYDWFQEQYPALGLNLHISRIYRDARRLFGRGPYKDHLWFSIKHGSILLEGPMFWFEIGAADYSYGMGFWAPKAALMEAYRKAVDEHPEVLEKLVKRFNKQAQFTLSGPEYARKKTAPSPLLAAWYNKKSINLQHDAAPDERMFSPELAQDIIEGFRTLMPLYKYFDGLCAAEMV